MSEKDKIRFGRIKEWRVMRRIQREERRRDRAAGGDDPVERAKRAGWKIDPRSEESMRRLPPESALYDVTGQPPSEVRFVEPDDPNTTFEHTRRPPGSDDESDLVGDKWTRFAPQDDQGGHMTKETADATEGPRLCPNCGTVMLEDGELVAGLYGEDFQQALADAREAAERENADIYITVALMPRDPPRDLPV